MLRRRTFAVLSASLLAAPARAQSPKTLRAVMHSDLKIIDPIWTTAYIARNHGYMIYDTRFALDAKLEPQPEMIESWTVSDDKLLWAFKLRDGLKWHDGAPVRPEDCIASLARWMKRDVLGQTLPAVIGEMKAVDGRTFSITLKKPFPLLLEAIGKLSSNVPFMMP